MVGTAALRRPRRVQRRNRRGSDGRPRMFRPLQAGGDAAARRPSPDVPR